MQAEIKELLIYQTYFVFVPFFRNKSRRNKAKYRIYGISYQFSFGFAGSRFEEK